ncbi:unnamed protein product, partial [Coregonus sp. 'balchen']
MGTKALRTSQYASRIRMQMPFSEWIEAVTIRILMNSLTCTHWNCTGPSQRWYSSSTEEILAQEDEDEEEMKGGSRGKEGAEERREQRRNCLLTCRSNTFDPFLCISLPIPLRQTRCMSVTLVLSTKGQRYLRVGLAVPLIGSISCLRAMVAEEGKITPDQVILSELYATGFQRSFSDDDDLTSVAESDVVYAFQAPPLHTRGGSTRIS